MVYFIWCVDKFCRIKIVRPILFTLAYERQLLKTSVTLEFTVGWGEKVYKKKNGHHVGHLLAVSKI